MNVGRLMIVSSLCSIILVAYLPRTNAQDADLQEPGQAFQQRDREAAAEREGGIPRNQVLQEDDENQQGTEEGMPRTRLAPDDRRVAPQWQRPDRQRWKLGVHAYNTETGVVITQVLPDSPARRAGFERGDRIVAVGGFQVGWIDNRLYPLGTELQRQAGARGQVKLLVQNVRDRTLLNLDVRLDGRVGRRGDIDNPRDVPPIRLPRVIEP